MRLTKGWLRDITPENLLGYSFIIKGKVGRRRRTLFFLSKCSVSIISSSSRLSSGVFLSPHSQARSTNDCFLCVQKALITELTGQDVRLMPPSFYFGEACLVLLLHGFVVSKPA